MFELKEEHIKLLQNFWITWNWYEYGAPSVDPKRPFGNSYVEGDIASILEIIPFKDSDGELHFTKEQIDKCNKIYKETETALQIVLSTKSFITGLYKCEQYTNKWVKV